MASRAAHRGRVDAFNALQTLGLRLPRLGLIAKASPAIQIHLICAVAAFLIETSLLPGRLFEQVFFS